MIYLAISRQHITSSPDFEVVDRTVFHITLVPDKFRGLLYWEDCYCVGTPEYFQTIQVQQQQSEVHRAEWNKG